MAMSKHSKVRCERGFTLLETLIAIVILTVGLLALAGFMSKMDLASNQSRYMGNVTLLASEKLESLNKVAKSDPVLAVGGSLTADVNGYNDQVAVSVGDGVFQEQVEGDYDPVTGKTATEIYTQGPDGVFHNDKPMAANTPVFTRRWLIENGSDVGLPASTKRITVLVTAPSQGAGKPATVQMSMVRYGG
jgi:prepilin-type N-terminal cleavage/methylation domain-containing protein